MILAHSLLMLVCQSGDRDERDLFGAAVASIGDLDGGGLGDIAIGDPSWHSNSRDRGQVWLVSTETGRSIRRIEPAIARLGFGWTLANVGDIDGDGRDDLAVGTMRWDFGGTSKWSGVTVISCSDARVLQEIPTDAEGFWRGWYSFGAGPVACGVGDWNKDGSADFAVGDPRYSEGAACRGRVDILSGKDGSRLHRFVGDVAHAGLGVSLCAIADVDGDGTSELAASAVPASDNACEARDAVPISLVRVYSSQGMTLASLQPKRASRGFGLALSRSGDLDADGREDLWIGEPFPNQRTEPLQRPAVESWSVGSWKPLVRVAPESLATGPDNSRFATAVLSIDDVDGDGLRDVFVTRPESWGSQGYVFTPTGKLLRQFAIDASFDASSMGMSAAKAGDLDGDGFSDVVIGGVTWRGPLIGTVSAWSPKEGKRIRDFTRVSLQPPRPR